MRTAEQNLEFQTQFAIRKAIRIIELGSEILSVTNKPRKLANRLAVARENLAEMLESLQFCENEIKELINKENTNSDGVYSEVIEHCCLRSDYN
ncbi:MAG: hypothetical protein WC725_05115 [Patescibacteria group bacterium]|jgi:chromosome segregation ATPase